MKQLFSILFILFVSYTYSQEDINNRSSIFISPLHFIDPFHPKLSIGFEKELNRTSSRLSLDAGYYVRTKKSLDSANIIDLPSIRGLSLEFNTKLVSLLTLA